jgi:Flp pilus assembly protein TadG
MLKGHTDRLTKRRKRKGRGSSSVEFAIVLVIILTIVSFVLSIFSVGTAIATFALASQHAAREAASAATRTRAQDKVNQISSTIFSSGLARFGGISNGNLTLFVEGNNLGATGFQTVPTNIVVDLRTTYRYRVRATGIISPMLWPQTINYSYDATGIIEHPEGLSI